MGEFEHERLGTALEAVAADGQVFIGTHAGNVYGLDAATGEPRWRVAAGAPVLHSPAVESNLTLFATTDGTVAAVDARSGTLHWRNVPPGAERGGFCAAPVIADGAVFLGSRGGDFFGLRLEDGALLWRAALAAPIRQTAAVSGGRVFITSEDLQTHAFNTRTGQELWTAHLAGQSARDYAPVAVEAGGGERLLIRTSPAVNMARRIALDRSLLANNAGADDRDWRKLDAWIKSGAARGSPELWQKEQAAVAARLRADPTARTFFVLDAATGAECPEPPVLWAGGCQGVGPPPVQTPEGRLLVFGRTAYGNWNHGVAPLVGLGLLNLENNRVDPLFHDAGAQPPWNTFWGTADEAQNFTVAGNLVLIAHQGTLSGFDLRTRHLFAIHGERDTFGGLPAPSWARNEWHGPARGGVAVAEGRVFWITGSRVLCLAAGKPAEVPPVRTLRADALPPAAVLTPPRPPDLKALLAKAVDELLSQRWAPLCVVPGLAGREFFFAHSRDTFEALAWAWPHLDARRQRDVRAWLAREWDEHPPYGAAGAYDLRGGARREYHVVPAEELVPPSSPVVPHPFCGVSAAWLYATRLGETNRVLAAWPQLGEAFRSWCSLNWRLDGAIGDVQANRYLAALMAFEDLAGLAGDPDLAAAARSKADETLLELVTWWRRAAAEPPRVLRGSSDLDRFITHGDAFSFKVAPHHHQLALFTGLTPKIAAAIRARSPESVDAIWSRFERTHATWWLVGEERQVHFGENFMDPPDLAESAFQALAWLHRGGAPELERRVDIPFARADLFFIRKAAMALEAREAASGNAAQP